MLTPVWFILVAIAIPCQAYLDDRVLLDQHWTGFSPTAGDVRRREDFKALQRGRHHVPQLSDNEPDKRSVGFSVLNIGTDRTGRFPTERSEDSYLRMRTGNTRSFEKTERSVRRVVSSPDRLSRQESLGSGRADVRHTQNDIRFEFRALDLRKQLRESRDRRLEETHEGVGNERLSTADAPAWVKEDSRRTVRSDSRDRMAPSRKRRYNDERSDILERQTDHTASYRSENDRWSSRSVRLSRFDESSRGIDARDNARRLERRIENNRLSRPDAMRSSFAGRRVVGKGSCFRDAMHQSHLAINHLKNMTGLAKKLSIRSNVATVRSAKDTVRLQTREQRSNGMLQLESVERRERLTRMAFNKGDEARASSGPSGDGSKQVMKVSTVRNENDKEVRSDLRYSRRVEARRGYIRTSPQSSRNRESRREGERYATGSIDRRRTTNDLSLIGRTLENVLDKRHAEREDGYLTSLGRTRFQEDKESRSERQHERDSGARDSRNDERRSERDEFVQKRSLPQSARHNDARSISVLRARVGVSRKILDGQDTRETSIQVYSARRQTRTVALSQTAEHRHRLSGLEDSHARTTSPRERHLVDEQGSTERDRDSRRYLFMSSQRTDSRRERCGETRYQYFRSNDFRDRTVADIRMSGDGRRIYRERENAVSVSPQITYGESHTSRMNRDGARLDRTRSSRDTEDAVYRRNPEDTRLSEVRNERHPLERRQRDRSDLEDIASNDHRYISIKQLSKTDLSLFRVEIPKAPSGEDLDQKQEERSHYAKNQKSPLFWDEFTPRTDSGLLRTVLTVGMVAWMAMSPSRKIMD